MSLSPALTQQIQGALNDNRRGAITGPVLRDLLLAIGTELGTGSGGTGANGKSAYEIAVTNGFNGNLTQWLASLVGPQGQPGTPGAKGDQGVKGDQGAGTTIKGAVANYASLPATGNMLGDVYLMQNAGNDPQGTAYAVGDGYVYKGGSPIWQYIGPIRGPAGPQGPAPDTSLYAVKASPDFSGTPTLAGQAIFSAGNFDASFVNKNRPGIVSRTRIEVIREWLTAKDYGMHNDGLEDTAAWQNLCTNVPDGASIGFFPGGRYVTGGPGTVPDGRSFKFHSLGTGRAEIATSGSSGDRTILQHTTTDCRSRLHLESLIFSTNGAVAGTALKLARPPGINAGTDQGWVLRDIIWRGISNYAGGNTVPSYNTGWFIGLDGTAMCNTIVEGCFFRGQDFDYQSAMLVLRDHSTGMRFTDNLALYSGAGIFMIDGAFAEGLVAIGNQLVAVRDGFYLGDGTGAPGAFISHNHINAYRFGVQAKNRVQMKVFDNLIYNWGGAGDGQGVSQDAKHFQGVALFGSSANPGCQDAMIKNNIIGGFLNSFGVVDCTGITLDYARGTQVDGNQLSACGQGISGSGVFQGFIRDNVFRNCPRNSEIVGINNWSHLSNNYAFTDIANNDITARVLVP